MNVWVITLERKGWGGKKNTKWEEKRNPGRQRAVWGDYLLLTDGPHKGGTETKKEKEQREKKDLSRGGMGT